MSPERLEPAYWEDRAHRARRAAFIAEVVRYVVLIAVVALVCLIGFSGRSNLRSAQLEDCYSTLGVVQALALSWRAQATADQTVSSDTAQPQITRTARARAARRHRITANVLERAGALDCEQANPKPSFFFG